MHKNGTINAQEYIEKMRANDLNEIPRNFQKIAETLRQEAKELLERSKLYARQSSLKNLRDLGIESIPENIALKPWESFSEKEANQYLPTIQEFRKKTVDEYTRKQIENIEKSLIAKIE